MNLPKVFIDLEKIFKSHGYSLYMVGGTSRDYLLGKEITDYDLVSEATPDQMKKFLDFDETYSSLGSVHLSFEGEKIDITTLREEGEYEDYRHPSKIKFIKSLEKDSLRRDFSINALYIDSKGKVYDYHHGLDDLKNHLIVMIGNPSTRFNEDPLRILRALRFSLVNDFSLTPSLRIEILNNTYLLKKISLVRSLSEIKKMKDFSYDKALWLLKIHHVDSFIPLKFKEKDRLDVIDLGALTLNRLDENSDLFSKDNQVNLKKMNESEYLLQVFDIEGTNFLEALEKIHLFNKMMEESFVICEKATRYQDLLNNKAKCKMNALLALNRVEPLEDSLDNLQEFYDHGVRILSFKGETKLPLDDLLTKCEELGIIVDLGHLEEKIQKDLLSKSTKPVLFRGCNSSKIQKHPDNLSDEMISLIKEKHGLIALTYEPTQVSSSVFNQIPDIIKHVRHFEELDATSTLSLASFFDSSFISLGMADCSQIKELKVALEMGNVDSSTIEKLFKTNALNLFKKTLVK